MTPWMPTVLLMRPGIGRNLGIAHRARNSCELRVELAVQCTVHVTVLPSRLSIQPPSPHTSLHGLIVPVVYQASSGLEKKELYLVSTLISNTRVRQQTTNKMLKFTV